VFHDENNNALLDKNFFGIPTENYGFSQNVRGTLGAPEFEAAAFSVQDTDIELHITLE